MELLFCFYDCRGWDSNTQPSALIHCATAAVFFCVLSAKPSISSLSNFFLVLCYLSLLIDHMVTWKIYSIQSNMKINFIICIWFRYNYLTKFSIVRLSIFYLITFTIGPISIKLNTMNPWVKDSRSFKKGSIFEKRDNNEVVKLYWQNLKILLIQSHRINFNYM